MKFNYQGRTQTGKIQYGVVEAASRESAFEALKSRGLYITAVEEAAIPFYARSLKIFERVTQKDIVIFSRELAILFKSKVGLIEIFQTLAQQTPSQIFKEKILKISEEVQGGTSLSAALAMHPNIFTPFYISMVKSGEASGKLTEIFVYLADYLEREYNFRNKLVGAAIYPAFIFLVFIGVVGIIITYVIPQLSSFLKESGSELPWVTNLIISISDFTVKNGLYIIIGIIAAIFGIYKFLRSPKGAKMFNDFLVRVPILGDFLIKIYLTRFAMNLSTLISGGLPIVQSLEITSEVIGNETYKRIILRVMDEVKKGEKMSSVLKNYPKYISPIFYQMIVVGEKSGTIDTSLTNVVQFYEQDVNKSLESFIKLLEPIMIIMLGLVVAGLVISVLMPIYSMNTF